MNFKTFEHLSNIVYFSLLKQDFKKSCTWDIVIYPFNIKLD